jgi:hypothetical protein
MQMAMLVNGVASGWSWNGTDGLAGDVLIKVAANTTVQFFNNSGVYQLAMSVSDQSPDKATCSIIFTRLQ